MMKLVVLAITLTAVSAGTTLVRPGLPFFGGVYGHAGLPFAGTYAAGTTILGSHNLPVAGTTILGSHNIPAAGHVLTSNIVPAHALPTAPVTYTAAAAPQLVAPAPYQVQTGVRTEVAVEPVEQHGYVIKY